MAFNWTCPYCGHAQAVTDARVSEADGPIWNDDSVYGRLAFRIVSVVCSNSSCRQIQLSLFVGGRASDERTILGKAIWSWPLLPESPAKPQPDFIPAPIVENYNQACRIRDLSPNASATMARRCLQGMIRDFCGIKKRTLGEEIDELRKRIDKGKAPPGVDPDTVDGIDHVRSIGNIGAHMEKDINLILDVDPEEAQTLIELIEILFKEWYVARETRNERLKRLGLVAENKKQIKEAAKLPPPQKKLTAPVGEAKNAAGEEEPEANPPEAD